MKRILKIIANKYIIASLVFLAMILFFSPYDVFTLQKSQKELDALKEKISFLNSESDRMDAELISLEKDTAKLEKYARELYHQKKDGEDVYLIK